MGHDFTYLRLKMPIDSFPFKPGKEFDFYTEVEQLPEVEVLASLLEKEGFRKNGKDEEGNMWYWWDTPGGGSLDVRLSKDRLTIGVDTHAHWKYVLSLLRFLKSHVVGLLVVDNPTITIYDDNSYNEYVKMNFGK